MIMSFSLQCLWKQITHQQISKKLQSFYFNNLERKFYLVKKHLYGIKGSIFTADYLIILYCRVYFYVVSGFPYLYLLLDNMTICNNYSNLIYRNIQKGKVIWPNNQTPMDNQPLELYHHWPRNLYKKGTIDN